MTNFLPRRSNPIRLILVTVYISLCTIHTSIGQESNPDQPADARSALLEKYVQAAHEHDHFNGVVFAAEKGHVIASVAVGISANEKKTPLDSTTLFEIASATKPFTAMAILILQEQGKLDIDDSIAKHLKNIPDHSKDITIRHLVTHRSGIPGESYGKITKDVDAVIVSMLGSGPEPKPGAKREYWNQGYAILSEIIAQASGMSYVDFCKKEIFQPAGMKSTCFSGDPAPPEVKVAVSPMTSLGPSRSALDHPYGSYGMQYRGMGGIVTNVEDLWRWSQAVNSGNLINEKSLSMMRSADEEGFSFGWTVKSHAKGYDSLGHNGTVRGFFTELRLYPNKDACLFLLANNNDSRVNFSVIKHCEEIVQSDPLTAIFPLNKTELEPMVGSYRIGRRVLTVLPFRSGSRFMPASIDWGGPVTRGILANDIDGKVCFFDGQTLTLIDFQMDKNGKPKTCKLGKTEFVREKK